MAVGLKRDRFPDHDAREAIASAARTIQLEAQGLSALEAALNFDLVDNFAEAVSIIRSCRGRVIVTGMGKSGHIGMKVAGTLSSTGTPASFVHPSEASHGDLGMITRDDVILAFSWSGETVELGNLVSYSRRFAVPPDRHHLECREHAGQGRGSGAGNSPKQGSLPAWARANHLNHDAACAWRLPRHCAP